MAVPMKLAKATFRIEVGASLEPALAVFYIPLLVPSS
jgi:hypothetical protein